MENRKKLAAGLAAVVGIGGAALGLGTVRPAVAQTPPVRRPFAGERHPELRRALMNLNQAKTNLQNAAHDFGGHREQALDLVNRAIDQVNKALADDKH